MDVVEIITTLTGLGAKIEISDNELRLDAAIGTIKPELRLAIREHKADIIRFLTRTRLKIAPAPVKGYYCLSSAQKRLFFIHEWDKESLAYNIPMVFRLEGRTDIDRLEMSFSELIRRHEILRTSFSIFDQEPVQVISPSVDFAVERYDDGQPVEAVIRQFVRPFDLGKPPLIRVGLMELKEQEHLLMIDVHHIVNDGASLWILMKDLLSIYQGNERPEASLQYKDYAEWQQSDEWNDIIAAQRQFWLQEFAGRPSVPDMPADFPRPAIKTFEGDEVRFTIDSEETGSLKKLAAAEGTTLYMVFFALFNVLIARLTNQEDIVVGTVTSGRTHADLENLIGVFVNTIPVRNYPEGKLRFREFFLSLTSRTVACIGNQDYQYEELVEQLKLERDTSHNPLFDIVFIYNQLEATKLTLPDIQLSPFDYSLTTAKFDLTLNAVESGGRVWLGFEYSTSIFRRTSIERFVGYFREIMHAVLANADIRLADIDILPRDEKQQLVIDFNDTKTDIRLPGTIPVAFEGVVLEKGKAAAITFKGKDVSYETLHAYSDRLAAAILARGIGKEAVVGIMISRSPTLLVSLLGVLKAGCAYVPIDPEYPAARIKYIAADSGMALLLTDDETANAYFGQTPVEIVAGDGACRPAGNRPGHLAGETIVHRPIDISPTGLAYLIYTSGSTGVPKGVMIEHRNVINFIQGVTDRIPFSGDGSILCLTTVSFDIFVLETLLPLLNGWRIVLAGADEQKDPLALAQLIQSQQVDYMQITPSHLKMLLAGIAGEDTLKSLKVVMVGGEAFPGSLLKELKRRYRGRIYNMYGPTETTVWSTIQDLTLADDICIGTPIANTYIRIIDANGNLQPVNVAGELCIGGGGVARGYWKREDLTASRFIADPATGEALIYRTGDLARWLPDGKIEFLGRMDSQVKLRGFRIELGEIESWLLRYDGIEEAVVIITGQEGDQQLAAYYVAGGDIPEMELREYLAQRLPVYMLPSFYVRLTKMPLTPNGKLDRRALPAPMQNPASTEYIAPGTKEEDLLAQVWSAVLKVERIGVNDNYFSLGGDSIKSIQIRSRLQAEGYELTVKDIFVYQTIGQLASRLKVTGSLVLQSVVTGIFPLSPGQHFLLREESAGSGANSRFVILDFPEDLSRTAIVSIADKLQQHHDALRTVFVRNGDKVMQENKELPFPVFLKEYYRPDGVGDSPDGAGDSPDGAEDILAIREELQSGIDLAIGPLMRLGLIHVDGGSRLLIVLHRLVADQRSCEILLEDIGALYSQQRQGRPFTLPPKTDAYVHWSLAVSTMVANAAPGSGSKPAPGSGSMPAAAARCGASFTLSVGMTARLVDMANRPFRTETPDILLTAWMQAVKRYSGNETQYICLELPGRALRVQHIHVSRAIGQFAIPYRLRFTIGGWSHKEMIRQVKEYLRGIAAMPADQEMAEGLPSVFFHYTDSAPEGRDSSEQGLPEYGMMDCDWELLVVHRAGTLTVRLRGGAGAGEWAGARAGEGAGATAGGGEGAGAGRREADRLLGIYRECLSELIDYCCICPDRLLSPSDLTYKDISIAQLDELQTKYLLEDLYPLSPMQEGMLFDDLMNKDSDNYFAQRCFRIKGQMDEVFIQKTMDDLASRYAILRTLFLHEGLERPLQVVLRERKVEFSFEDIREAGRERSREDLLAEYEAADMRRGFDLEKDALMRLKVLHTGTDEFDMIWSFHHILMDGWCTGIIIRDFKEIYARYTTGSARLIPPARPYADYILWLQGRGKEASEQYWKEYLAGYEKPAGLPELVTGKVNYRRESRHWSMDAALVEKLKRISGGYGVTVNSIFQAAWAILLSRYNNTEEVVFGSTVSGRPAEIEGIESMVGLFINSVPVRVTCKEEDTVHDLLQKVQEMALESEPHHYHPLAEIQSCSELGRELLNHVIVFENFPFPDDEDEVGSFQVTGIRSFDQNNYELWLGVIPGEEYLVAFDYNANRFSTDTISGVIQYLKLLLAKMADGLVMRLNDVSARVLLVRDLKMLPEEERYRLLEGYNRGRLVAGERRGLMELLRCQVTRTPERCGLVCGEDRLTYGELWELSDALAEVVRRLRGDSEIVGMYMEPGAWMAAGMVGIWKAGCGFLPLEPGQGRERQERILQVSGCRLLLTERQYYGELRFEGKQWAVDGGVELPEREKMGCGEGSGELAYVIYTSGSTGEPKGVKIRRENLVNYVGWVQRSLGLTSSDRTVLTSSYAFDLGYTSLFPVLFCGGELHLLSREQYRSPSGLLGYIRDAGISYVKMTPSLFSTLVEAPGFEGYGLGALRFVVLGGERIRVGDIDRAHQAYGHIRFMNHYGPTETTIGVIAGEIEDWEGFVARPDIGRPIDGSGVYILDRSGELLPEGVVGEIGIGGAGVGGGYVGREELTRERFIPVDWLGEGRVYRTGDLGRWIKGGRIEYLGRMDQQVKIDGYRVELGEIEARLSGYVGIGSSAVVLRQRGEESYLAAYYVSQEEIEEEWLRLWLTSGLPDYMVPSVLIRLESLPLTRNGKLDVKALPEAGMTNEQSRVPPSNEIEEKLLEIWTKVLRSDKIGVTDSFFSMGGDSIKSIQITARMRAAGYQVSVNDIFRAPTIRELALKAQPLTAGPRKASHGKSVLSPIQRLFMEHPSPDKHHYNQSIMLHFPDGISAVQVKNIFDKLQEQHEALRYVFKQEQGQWMQLIPERAPAVSILEQVGGDIDSPDGWMAACNAVQQGLNLENGPLMKLGLFHNREGSDLLIVIHHLVVDGVSWRILFEDIETLYRQIKEEQPLALPQASESFFSWVSFLSTYSKSEQSTGTIEYWSRIQQTSSFTASVRDYPEGRNQYGDTAGKSFNLSKEDTTLLLTRANEAFQTEVNDILLTAFLLAINQCYHLDTVSIDLEGHGRESFSNGPDISRTVGWFTVEYPITLKIAGSDPGANLRYVKETLRQVPNKGFDYLLYAFPTDAGMSLSRPRHSSLHSLVKFNYLGQFDSDIEDKSFGIAGERSRGNDQAASTVRENDWFINGSVAGDRLTLNLSYSRRQYSGESAEALMEAYRDQLTRLIRYCASGGEKMQELHLLQTKYTLEDVYPLSPMQEGLLFHALLDPASGGYFEQKLLRVKGNLDIPAMEKSLNALISRHTILRTIFVNEGLRRPLQVVLKERKIEITYFDIREECRRRPADELVEEYRVADRSKPFDLVEDILLRLTVLRLGEDQYEMLWSSHHILMDGWCMGVLINEFGLIYRATLSGLPLLLDPPTPYSLYIRWLEKKDQEESQLYWKGYLSGYDRVAGIPRKDSVLSESLPYSSGMEPLILPKEQTKALQAISARQGVTLNTLLQCAWGLLLAKYNLQDDVVFGTVVSGRPADIEGIETMVGLFINTVPVRLKWSPGDSIAGLLRTAQEQVLQREPHQYASLPAVQAGHELGRELFDHILVFDNYPEADMVSAEDADEDFQITQVKLFEQTNYDLWLMLIPGDQFVIQFHYNRNSYDTEAIRTLSSRLAMVIRQIVEDIRMPASALTILTAEEERRIRVEWNSTEANYPRGRNGYGDVWRAGGKNAEQYRSPVRQAGSHLSRTAGKRYEDRRLLTGVRRDRRGGSGGSSDGERSGSYLFYLRHSDGRGRLCAYGPSSSGGKESHGYYGFSAEGGNQQGKVPG
jgi:amino acid adenylation domain-containing protein/non-ribosomal peptide synthase protein (TIGR01720 family)